jgi:ABC-type nitrate/sulfonate/bicarbonate transport system, permease component
VERRNLVAQEVIVEQRESWIDLNTIQAKVIFTIVSILLFGAIWELAAKLINNHVILPTPISSFKALYLLIQNKIPPGAAGVGSFESMLLQTLEITAIGFLLSSAVGIPIGYLIGRWRAAEAIIDPWINALYAIPMVALIPLLYFGSGSLIPVSVFDYQGDLLPDVLVSFIMAVFTIIINTYQGVRLVSNSLVEVGKAFGASENQLTRHVVIPAALPDIVAGMRLGLGRALLGAIIAEALLSTNGLGYAMLAFQSILNTPYMVATIMVIAFIGFVLLQTPKLIERRLFKWKETERIKRGGNE